jgi:hypothetical protein
LLVRCGWLYDVQAWLANGKPSRTTTRTSVTVFGLCTQWVSQQVEVALAAGLNSTEITEMLSEAVCTHREDLSRLLIDCGG